nr:TetR-like C-terminal domain-containing protein [Rhodococcus sp. Q1]
MPQGDRGRSPRPLPRRLPGVSHEYDTIGSARAGLVRQFGVRLHRPAECTTAPGIRAIPHRPDSVPARGIRAWSSLFGVVGSEVFGQYGPDTSPDRGVLFEHHLALWPHTVGFRPTRR